jgi:hypothetical protein
MAGRALFAFITVFWIVMNGLLWRAEYGSQQTAPVGLQTVWERVLTAADSSSLQVYHQKELLGVIRWTPSITAVEDASSTNDPPEGLEGMVRKAESYHIELDGSLQWEDATQRFRFNGSIDLDSKQRWREFEFLIHQRRNTWQVGARAREQRLRLSWQEGGAKTEHTVPFADLANPQSLLGGLGVLIPPGLLPGTLAQTGETNSLASRLQWTANQDILHVGNARLRVYRIRARLFDRLEAVIYVNRAGELLKIELPDHIRLVNTAFPQL